MAPPVFAIDTGKKGNSRASAEVKLIQQNHWNFNEKAG